MRLPCNLLSLAALGARLARAFPIASKSSCAGKDEVWQLCPDNPPCANCEPVDCKFGEWTQWGDGDCTGVCMRHRSVSRRNNECGEPCSGTLVETKTCRTICEDDRANVVDCEFGEWSPWSKCDGEATQKYRSRSIKALPTESGKTCDDGTSETMPCDVDIDDAEVFEWSEWSGCDADCDTGEQTRSRVVKNSDAGGAGFAGSLKVVRPCPGLKPCTENVDCKWSDWQEWSGCSCSCGGGSRSRDRYIAVAPLGLGKLCDALDKSEVEACNTQSCAACIDGEWGSWTEWEDCSATCAEGVTWRNRRVMTPGNECGNPPEGLSQESKLCNQDKSCTKDKIDCEFAQWTPWSGCSCRCDGAKERSRGIVTPGVGSGKFCVGPLAEVAPCNQGADGCPAKLVNVDCVLGDWQPWTKCSGSCGTGQQSRTRKIITLPQLKGKQCKASLEEMRACDAGKCPSPHDSVDCEWGDWGEWGACTKCNGQKHRNRHVLHHAAHGGAPCAFGAASEVAACPRSCHDVFSCEWADWRSWGACTTTCGPGARKRIRELEVTKAKAISDVELTPELLQSLEVSEPHRTQDLVLSFAAGCLSLVMVLGVTRLVRAAPMSSRDIERHVDNVAE